MTLAQIVGNYDNPKSLGSKFRAQRFGPLRAMIERVYREKGSVSILDVGGMEKYWNIVSTDWLRDHRVQVVMLNLEKDIFPVTHADVFQHELGDGCRLEYADNSFDICHSNSVIEHVGDWGKKTAFAREVRRVAPLYFHQTPNFWFPWEPHFGFPFFHWLPDATKLWVARHRKLGWTEKTSDMEAGMWIVEHADLLNYRMMAHLFPDAEIIREKLVGLNKSFVAVRASGPVVPVVERVAAYA